jgi:hypothetical protein
MSLEPECPPDSGFEKVKTMKKIVVRIAFVTAALVTVFSGCGSPWVKSLTASLYEEPDLVTIMNNEDFGAGAAIAGTFNAYDLTSWNAAVAGINAPGNYVVNVTGTIAPTTAVIFTYPNTTVSLRGNGGSLDFTFGSGAFVNTFTVNSGQRLIVRNLTITKLVVNDKLSLLHINGGTITLEAGAKLTGNLAQSSNGGGVYIQSGTLEMKAGSEISGNTTTNGEGGGVYIDSGGIFNMYGGEIKGNIAVENGVLHGGGVYVGIGGSFNKTGGVIEGSGSTYPNECQDSFNVLVSGHGHAVYIDDLFTPTIHDNTF